MFVLSWMMAQIGTNASWVGVAFANRGPGKKWEVKTGRKASQDQEGERKRKWEGTVNINWRTCRWREGCGACWLRESIEER